MYCSHGEKLATSFKTLVFKVCTGRQKNRWKLTFILLNAFELIFITCICRELIIAYVPVTNVISLFKNIHAVNTEYKV